MMKKPRFLVLPKWSLLLLLVGVLSFHFIITSYHTERVSMLEDRLDDYRANNFALKEDKRHIQEKFLEMTEEEANFEAGYESEGEDGEAKESLGGGKKAYLSFDDGPSDLTPELLDVLKENQVKATFFVNGEVTCYGRYIYRRILAEGHALGNHTYSHLYHRIYSGKKEFMKDFLELEDLLYRSTGTRPRIMRFPGGSNNTVSESVAGRNIMPDIIRKLLDEGYTYFDWNVYGLDGTLPVPSSSEIARAVLYQASYHEEMGNDLYILLHDNNYNQTTIQALPEIIEGIHQKGYRFEIMTPQTPPYRFSVKTNLSS